MSRSGNYFIQHFFRLTATILLLTCLALVLAGCGGHKQARVKVPPPPQPAPLPQNGPAAPREPQVPSSEQAPAADQETADEEVSSIPPDSKPLVVETGLASWYGPPYHNRRSSNGEVYNMNAFTAAHRTLPLGSIVRVTNVKTGNSVLVRITDRGPFIDGRILDLSLAAAKKIDLWRAGVGPVKMEVLKTPVPLETGGRWAVQIGAFEQEQTANEIAGHLSHRYRTARVLCFNSPVGDWWVRVRVKDDDRRRAEEVAHDTQTTQGSIFLVRLD
jgi:rare lipoprotein A